MNFMTICCIPTHHKPVPPIRIDRPATMSQNNNSITPAPYKIFAFLVGVHGKTGPRLISVHRKQPCAILPVLEHDMFPDDADICSTTTVVQNRHYCVYFDRTRHLHDSKRASYLFVHVLYPGRPIDFCPEDDLPDIIESLKEYVFPPLAPHSPTNLAQALIKNSCPQ